MCALRRRSRPTPTPTDVKPSATSGIVGPPVRGKVPPDPLAIVVVVGADDELSRPETVELVDAGAAVVVVVEPWCVTGAAVVDVVDVVVDVVDEVVVVVGFTVVEVVDVVVVVVGFTVVEVVDVVVVVVGFTVVVVVDVEVVEVEVVEVEVVEVVVEVDVVEVEVDGAVERIGEKVSRNDTLPFLFGSVSAEFNTPLSSPCVALSTQPGTGGFCGTSAGVLKPPCATVPMPVVAL